jgi:hypothetical protein
MHRSQIALCYGTGPQVMKANALRSRLGTRYSVVAVDLGYLESLALAIGTHRRRWSN